MNAAPGMYRVNIGVYGPDGQRLPATRPQGNSPDGIVSFSVVVDP
jgi:hypothetical protein